MRPRLLYLAFYFPPTRASGVYRSRATANHFADAGWDVTVLTVQREFFRDYIHSFDPALEDTVRPEVDVLRVPFSGELWEPDIRRYGAMRVYAPRLWRRWWQWRNTRDFPEMYTPWIEPALKAALAAHKTQPFDAVIATGNPFAAFAIAWRFHRETGVPYFIDYRDSWTLNLFTERPAVPPRHPAWRWEHRVISAASAVAFVNEPLRRWHAERYPDSPERLMVVENGWDPDLLGDVAPIRRVTDAPRFGYLGTLMRQMPLDEFIAGWRRAMSDEDMRGATAELYGHLGYFAGSSAEYLNRIERASEVGIRYAGPVSKTEVKAVYESIDVLLLVIAGSRFVTSGKVYEYMATGRPIVSVHEPFCAASDVLRGYPLWFPAASLAEDDVAAALVAAARAARTMTPEIVDRARDHAKRFTRNAQIELLERRVRQIIVDGQPATPQLLDPSTRAQQ